MQNYTEQILSIIVLFLLSILITNPVKAQQFQLDPGMISTTESDSRSVNFFDLENDGFQDIYISNGRSSGQKDILYRNIGGNFLLPITAMDIVEASNPSDGASFADFNNDGHVDAVISSWYGAEDLLYLNNGNASLDYSDNSGIVSGSFAETAAFGDYDNDGWLDLYITNSGGDKVNFLYRNLRNGKFERILNHTLIDQSKLSRAAIWGDFNDDGHLDLFVTNENNAKNDLYYGTGDGNYVKQTGNSVVNSSKGSMTASWADIDNDGDLDLFVGNSGYFSGQRNQLFLNTGNSFMEVSNSPVSADSKCSFGSSFADFDNDGDLDLAVANGFCNQGMANELYENQGDGTFVKVSNLLVSNNNICSFGLAWGDINNDGFLELMIANCKNNNSDIEHPNSLLRNLGNENNWMQISLTGTESNRNAIGAKLFLLCKIDGKDIWQRRDVSAQTGYAGQNSLVSHFGLGDASRVDSLVIHWPSGIVESFSELEINQILKITEGMISAVKYVQLPGITGIKVFPNPIHQQDSSIQLSVHTEDNLRQANLSLINMMGEVLFQKTIELRKGHNELELDLTNTLLTQGMYQIFLQSDKGNFTQKLIVADN